jgi:1,4-alpha-glucan branching enzyme
MEKVLHDDLHQVVVDFVYDAGEAAARVSLVGEFNGWSLDADPMQPCGGGRFRLQRVLEPGRHFRYRFVVDGGRWETDPNAEAFEPDGHGGVNGVVRTDDVSE